MHVWTPHVIVAFLWSLAPVLAFGFAGDQIIRLCQRVPIVVRLILPAVFGVPYALAGSEWSRGNWLVIYFGLPIVIAVLLLHASQYDPKQRGDWRDFTVLLLLGLAVDLRWFEPAWPAHLSVISKLILLDSGLYGFLVVRQLTDVGFDLRMHWEDVTIGLRESLFFAVIAIPLGLVLGFLHLQNRLPKLDSAGLTLVFTFFLIAIPEEIFFRGWMQNLLERRLGARFALWLTAAIFGLSHFNKRATQFNWRYVLLAAIAGIFYGRAWRSRRRVAASAITHTLVDTVWSLWL
ncbi:MAG TPA: CPBP family intramembrane glutamic endopeptidase [Terriglobales bacterium]|nr:CPBP family intramembrane glutamic endopeptidase [Terriglobales bacterium]